MDRVVHLEASDAQQAVGRARHYPRAAGWRCEFGAVAFHKDAEVIHARRHRRARYCRVGEAVRDWQRAADVCSHSAACVAGANVKSAGAIGEADDHRRRAGSAELSRSREQAFGELFEADRAINEGARHRRIEGVASAGGEADDVAVQR